MNYKDFPYPFKGDTYRYSNNSEPMETDECISVTEHYIEEMKLKRHLLTHHSERTYKSLSQSMMAQWEVLRLVIDHLTSCYPDKFSLEQKGNSWLFHNLLLNEKHSFTYGDESSLPQEPLDFIGRHVQEDLIIMGQRDDNLYLEAGQLCFPANWSLAFNLGMSFKEIHSPIPSFNEQALEDRILKFLLSLETGQPWWRKNWSLMAGNRLDTSLETFDVWGKERMNVTPDNVGSVVHLRVEVQKLYRLPRSHAILFTIHTHILPLKEFVLNREWLKQFHSILSEMPFNIYDYKGISLYKDTVLNYLTAQIRNDLGNV